MSDAPSWHPEDEPIAPQEVTRTVDGERRHYDPRPMTDDEMREMEARRWRTPLHFRVVRHEVRDPDPVGDAFRSIIGWWQR